MKACTSLLAGIALLLSGCSSGSSMGMSSNATGTSSNPTSNPTSSNEWTWVAGSDLANQAGIYGTQGTAAGGNIPGGREGEVSWTDASGNFWLFGGIAAPSTTADNYFNDLWKYGAGQWTWMGGSNGYNQVGIYGTQGVASPGSIPGARVGAVSWKDAPGSFWLFGGTGISANGLNELFNDLWKYSAGVWTWMGGPDVQMQNQPGVYGTQGTAAPSNIPGPRSNAASWTDASGNFWLFGGTGSDSAGTLGFLNDLWRYSGGEWTWMGGANVVNRQGTYGFRGTPAPGNTPGARFEAASWKDAAGNLWLFGGSSGQNTFVPWNDLWEYSGGEWTWVSGSSIPNQNGVYGTQGIAAPGNNPGARASAVTWTDAAGNLWLFGGDGYDSVGGLDELNDLWKYSAGEWTWIAGSNIAGRHGTYGTLGTPATTSIPGGRSQSTEWTDTSGNFWIFGGYGFDATGTLGYLNDLWRYQP